MKFYNSRQFVSHSVVSILGNLPGHLSTLPTKANGQWATVEGRRGAGGIGKRTMRGCNCPCGSILLCGVALIIHVSINCHFVVIVVHTPFSPSLNTLTRGAAASVRIDFEVPRRISSFCSPSSCMRWLIPTRCCQNFLMACGLTENFGCFFCAICCD